MRVPFNYLPDQFADPEPYIAEWRRLIISSEFTIGPFVEDFERKFAAFVGARHCVSTNNGTDALILALKAAGISAGDEVITVVNTFYATVGAIVSCGAKPVFVDCDDRYQIDVERIAEAITPRTRAILPVHWAGCSPDIVSIVAIADARGLVVVEDACPAVGAYVNGRHSGTFGKFGAFSMHPLKPLNVMGDGGMVITQDDAAADWMRKYRNHGMTDRDHIEFWGLNMRLQPLQAIVASHVLDTVPDLVRIRNRNARQLDEGFQQLTDFVRLPDRPSSNIEAYQLYMGCFQNRDDLLRFLISRKIEAKVHYPLPLHLQKAAERLGYKRGDFPNSERQADELITLPAHQFITPEQIEIVLQSIRAFYLG
ncbi:MAG TPA: DegT/DnrJ/EryC1/StrS family aminotransferase [Terriglobia bacterium]|nr:DegT/DnrJ/EryC1/StrS family aminotransferase [Terriglobia bacterium]